MHNLNILFPIESIKREIDTKLFIAVMLSSSERVIYIGQHNVIDSLLSKMKIGIYFGKNIFKTEFPKVNLTYYRKLKKRGFNLVYLDEEGGIYPGDKKKREDILRLRLDPSVLSDSDIICSWGSFQDKIHSTPNRNMDQVTGHPKFDLYKKEYRSFFNKDVNYIKDKYSKFILIDTLYTAFNHCYGTTYAHSLLSGHSDINNRILATQEWAYQCQMMGKMISLVISLSAKFKDWNIIVRAHPGEDVKIYQEIFVGIDNIFVVNTGPVSPWILASSVMIHNNCSTAIEANLGEIPVISYDPITSKHKVNIANHVGALCKTEEEVFNAIGSIDNFKSSLIANQFDNEDKEMLLNISKNSFHLVKNAIEKSISTLPSNPKSPNLVNLKLMELKRILFFKIKYPLRLFFPQKMKFYSANYSIFYGFNKQSTLHKLNQIEQITGKTVECTFISDHLFTIKAIK